MSLLKKILLGVGIALITLVVLFVLIIGPWPCYKDSHFESSSYYAKALADIDASVADSEITATPGHFKAGWAQRIITPEVGVPLGGYGDRQGAASTGVHDDLYVDALAVSDGKDEAVIAGSDMLIIPPNVADMVHEQVCAATPLKPEDIYLGASHTHCGPGALGPGLAAYFSFGKYDPKVPAFIAKQFADAIIEAYGKMESASLAHGSVDSPQFIRNRARDGVPVDAGLDFMVAKQDDGDMLYFVRYSAHPTNYGGRSMLQFSAEFPGQLKKYLRALTNQSAAYIGGSLGSSGPRRPDVEGYEGDSPAKLDAQIEAMGRGLAELVVAAAKDLRYETNLDIVTEGTPFGLPPLQLRPFKPSFRLSPLAGKIMGVPPYGYISGLRIGNLMLIGMPYDLSGEISLEWKQWAKDQGVDLWPTGFSKAYLGYLSPDKYYNVLDKHGALGYETGFMSWFGPNAEAYMTDLFHHAFKQMTPQPVKTAAVQ